MKDTGVSHTPPRPSRALRLLAAWRGAAELGMLLDGRAHAWSGEAVRSEPGRRTSPAKGRAVGVPRLAKILA
jgi:hypothetical protein